MGLGTDGGDEYFCPLKVHHLSGVSRISARGCLRSGPIREGWGGGGGGGGAVDFWPDTKRGGGGGGGGGCCRFLA